MTPCLPTPERNFCLATPLIRERRSTLVTTTISPTMVSVPSPDNWNPDFGAMAAPSSSNCPISSGAALVVEFVFRDNHQRDIRQIVTAFFASLHLCVSNRQQKRNSRKDAKSQRTTDVASFYFQE